MKSKSKSNALVLTLSILGVALGATAVGLALFAASSTKTVIDESALYIGVPKEHDDGPVTLYLSVKSSNGAIDREYSSYDLGKLSSQDAGIRFLDYASYPPLPYSGKIGYWLSDKHNAITAKVTVNGVIESAEVSIHSSGIWFLDVPEKAGSKPRVAHEYCYEAKPFSFGGENL